ncbi:hypothetical protein RGQ29_031870 [Quercus rubra]|uniref:Mitochondrial succinate-fumarate transporter 1 n=1 Tax=Quercus rubra TaxID=3512 RepID=A0AAN7DTH7_QUERU|nr:hypothetical protein RGQ29_031870 [Quercus rubra]
MKSEESQFPEKKPQRKTIPLYMKAISGSLGGIMEASCLQPIDVIKTRLQLDRSGNYKGIIHCGTTITRSEGYTLRMGSNAMFQGAFKDSETGKISNKGRLLSGFGAGVLEALAIVTPFEQQRGLSPELLKYKGPVHCARMIIREEGILVSGQGLLQLLCVTGQTRLPCLQQKMLLMYYYGRKHEGDGKVLQPWQSMISGFLAGTAGPVCTGPFDVVKTRLMAQTRDGGALKYKGMIHAIRTIYAEEGLLALWKGLLPRLMRIPPGQAIMWAVADQVTGFYERRYLRGAPL